MRCDDMDDMTLKYHVRRQDTLQFTKRKAHPGPWPSILVSLLSNKCSEQAAAGSGRQQAEAATESRQQHRVAGRTRSKIISHI